MSCSKKAGMDETKENGARKSKTRDRGLFERPKGSGVWWVRYVDEHGRLHREKVGPKGLATKVYQKRKNEVQERRFFPERIGRRDVLVSEMIDEHLGRVKGILRSYYSHKLYAGYWKKALPNKSLRQVVPGDIERYVAKRITQVSPASVNRELAFLKRVFNVAIADGKAESNPVRSVKLFKENNKRVRFLAPEEETALRKAIGEEEWPLVAVAMHTGLRQAEQFHLRWEHVDFNTGILTVSRSKHGELRRVSMNDTVREILRSRPSRLKSKWVFSSETGETPIDAKNYMHRVFSKALTDGKIEGFRWHDLRHTFASRLVMAGVDLRTVQDLLGHKNVAMTLRYSHLSPAHQLDAVQRLNAKPATDTTTDTGKEAQRAAVGADTQPEDSKGKENAPWLTRTADPLIRSQVLYPSELRERTGVRAG